MNSAHIIRNADDTLTATHEDGRQVTDGLKHVITEMRTWGVDISNVTMPDDGEPGCLRGFQYTQLYACLKRIDGGS